ncbi:hypothetical protein HanIR_Chr09g0411501 [Helianthus annuus]|nr:hypothetical protein HanIR_Chr09g0411501 [Helianthus annuus]
MIKFSLVNFELFVRFHFCAYIILLLFIRLCIISMHNFSSDFLTLTINSASFSHLTTTSPMG